MLDNLISELRTTDPAQRTDGDMSWVLGVLTADYAAWDLRLPYRQQAYTRTCAYRDGNFEIVLLHWAAGAASAIHDHGGQRCWLTVLEGELAIDDYTRLDDGEDEGRALIVPTASRKLRAGGLDTRSGRFDLHRVGSAGKRAAVSLHVYAQPLRSFGIYDEFAQTRRTVYASYDRVLAPFDEATA